MPVRKNTALSNILSKAAAPVVGQDTTFAAFKALPIDPTRTRRDSGSFIEPADELSGATNCKQAVDLIVDSIRRAWEDAGVRQCEFVTEEDIVRCATSAHCPFPSIDHKLAAWLTLNE